MNASPLFGLLFGLVFSFAGQAADPPEKFFELEVPRGPATTKPRVLRVEKDDLVRLRATSAVAGEIHIHGYRLEAKLTAGAPHELAFKARATGRYRIEWHPSDDTARKSDHHGPPLATLEVRPK
jgi:heme/copper-type cytochrome/quinol oxidase subunit 2